MLVHGIAPGELILGTMISLIKDSRASKQFSDNYRALTIGTGLSKLLDIVILNRQTDVLQTSELQFGFPPLCAHLWYLRLLHIIKVREAVSMCCYWMHQKHLIE